MSRNLASLLGRTFLGASGAAVLRELSHQLAAGTAVITRRGAHRRRGGDVEAAAAPRLVDALEAANPAYETRVLGPDRVKIQGKLVSLLRRY